VDADGFSKDPIQLANALKAFAELRQNTAISDDDYDKVKAQVLAALEKKLLTPEAAPPPQTTAAPKLPEGIEDHAGYLHRMIAEKLAQDYPGGTDTTPEQRKRYLLTMAALLIEKGALHPGDMSRMTRVIETAMDDSYASSLERLVQGFIQLSQIHKEVRSSPDSSPLAKTIAGIASDSAEKAIEATTSTTPAAGSQAAEAQRAAAEARRKSYWGSVKEDVTGAFVGAGSIAAVVAVVAALAPAAAPIIAAAAVVGGGMQSGFELARTRPSRS